MRNVSRTGGHLGPNLGVVELTIALHRVFDSPRDPIVFDTGHQAYVHKMLTGRADGFGTLRQRGRAVRLPAAGPRAEHDWSRTSHASTALSYADGIAKAFAAARAEPTGHVVAVDRRRRADRRHGLGGAEQHRRRQGPAGRHRRQRQRPLLRADHRRPGPPPRHAAHHAAATSAFLDVGQGSCSARTPVVGPPLYDDAARR